MKNPSPRREPESVPVCFSLGSGRKRREEKGEREQKERQEEKGALKERKREAGFFYEFPHGQTLT